MKENIPEPIQGKPFINASVTLRQRSSIQDEFTDGLDINDFMAPLPGSGDPRVLVHGSLRWALLRLLVPVSYGSRWFQVSMAAGEDIPGFLREGGPGWDPVTLVMEAPWF